MENILTLMKWIAISLSIAGIGVVAALVRKGLRRKRKVPFYDYRFKDWRVQADPEWSEHNGQRF